MKKLLGILALLIAFGLPSLAQMQRMAPDDQDKFNSYYSRWLQDKQTNDRDDMIHMEQRMQDVMANTEFLRIPRMKKSRHRLDTWGLAVMTIEIGIAAMPDRGRDECLLMISATSTKSIESGR